jgi:hypothetical protein
VDPISLDVSNQISLDVSNQNLASLFFASGLEIAERGVNLTRWQDDCEMVGDVNDAFALLVLSKKLSP